MVRKITFSDSGNGPASPKKGDLMTDEVYMWSFEEEGIWDGGEKVEGTYVLLPESDAELIAHAIHLLIDGMAISKTDSPSPSGQRFEAMKRFRDAVLGGGEDG